MADTKTAGSEAMWNYDVLSMLIAYLPAEVGNVVLAYAGDIRRVFFERIFQVKRRHLGPHVTVLYDVTKLHSVQTSETEHHAWRITYRDIRRPPRSIVKRPSSGMTSCQRFKGDPHTLQMCPSHQPTFAAAITAQELWDFMAGGESPTLCILVGDPLGGGTLTRRLMIDFRRNLRLKIARWCVAQECAAVGRPRAVTDLLCASEIRRCVINECAAVARSWLKK